MKKLSFVLLLLVFISSCQDIKFAKKPKSLLDEDTMVEVITDLVIYDAAFSVNEYKLKDFDKDLNQFLIRKYEIDSTILAQNIAYYNEQYDQNTDIYRRVGQNIDIKRDYFDSIRKVNDSIKRARKERKRDTISDNSSKANIQKAKD